MASNNTHGLSQHPPKQRFSPSVAWLALFLDSHMAEIKVLAVLNCFMEAPRINVLLISLGMWVEFDFPGLLPSWAVLSFSRPTTWFLSYGTIGDKSKATSQFASLWPACCFTFWLWAIFYLFVCLFGGWLVGLSLYLLLFFWRCESLYSVCLDDRG